MLWRNMSFTEMVRPGCPYTSIHSNYHTFDYIIYVYICILYALKTVKDVRVPNGLHGDPVKRPRRQSSSRMMWRKWLNRLNVPRLGPPSCCGYLPHQRHRAHQPEAFGNLVQHDKLVTYQAHWRWRSRRQVCYSSSTKWDMMWSGTLFSLCYFVIVELRAPAMPFRLEAFVVVKLRILCWQHRFEKG